MHTLNMDGRNHIDSISDIPILLILHVRSGNLEKQLMILKQAGISKIYVSIDGPRNEADQANQELLHLIISRYKKEFKELNIRESKCNRGIAVAVISAIDWFYSQNDYGIIFEDDIEFTIDTLNYFWGALNSIQSRPAILMASGFQPFSKESQEPKVTFTNYPQIWGWATHAFKWEQMRQFIFTQPQVSSKLNRKVRNFWSVGWKRVSEGYLDTWDLPIATGMLFSRQLCMLPPVNLTSNIGVDSYSTHTHNPTFPIGLAIEKLHQRIDFEIEPVEEEVIEINRKFERNMYSVGLKNLLTPILQKFDRYRFSQSKKDALAIRMNAK
jgi:hypothetical protein